MILESLDEENVITIKQRRCLVRILLSHLVEKLGDRYLKIVFSPIILLECYFEMMYESSINLLSGERIRQDITFQV